jgi:hypothetical protein
MKITVSGLMAGALLALFGCSSSDFNTPTKLNKVRILAIQAEPPQPALGAATTLRALVYQPPGVDGGSGDALTYSWSWCPLATNSSNGYTCPIDQATADQLFAGLPGVPPLDLGTGEQAIFTNPFPSALLASLCENNLDAIPALAGAGGELAASGGLNFSCSVRGYPITVTLVVHKPAGESPAVDLPAVFRVYLPINDSIAPNVNPVLGDIKVAVSGSEPNLVVDQVGTQGILRNSAVPISVYMPPSDSEPVPTPNEVLPNPNKPDEPFVYSYGYPNERLNLNWYAECGDFGGEGLGGDGTGYIPGDSQSTFDRAQRNTWNLPKEEGCPAYLARITVVVIDNRGGANWTTGVVHLGDTNSGPDAGAPDGQEADSGEPVPDAESPDSEQADGVDALLETTP